MWEILAKLIDADKLGGWVRAGVAALLAIIIGRWPVVGSLVGSELQTAVGVLASGIVVGIWSQLTKSDAAKVAMAANVDAVKKIEVTDPALKQASAAPEVVVK
jgi:hypothetical protein